MFHNYISDLGHRCHQSGHLRRWLMRMSQAVTVYSDYWIFKKKIVLSRGIICDCDNSWERKNTEMWFAVSCMPKISSERALYDPYTDTVNLYAYSEPELSKYRSRSSHFSRNNPQSKSRPSEYIPYGLSPKSSLISPMSPAVSVNDAKCFWDVNDGRKNDFELCCAFLHVWIDQRASTGWCVQVHTCLLCTPISLSMPVFKRAAKGRNYLSGKLWRLEWTSAMVTENMFFKY